MCQLPCSFCLAIARCLGARAASHPPPLAHVQQHLTDCKSSKASMSASTEGPRTLGQHVASRLTEIGVQKFFGVPGDYNLQLLDELVKEKGLEGVWCCNELNAGYAADGYARVQGVGCLVVTYTVGGLSAINAVAGAYAENLPVLCICGGPNSNDFGSGRVIHHTIGKPLDFLQEYNCFKNVTCEQVIIQSLDNAHELLDKAISAALVNSKPAYICICCNLAGLCHPTFERTPIPYRLSLKLSNGESLAAAVDASAAFLASKQKPVLVAGSLLRLAKAGKAFMSLVESSGYPYAHMPAAKSFVPESHPQYMETYWGQMSSPFAGEVVESADAYLFAGAVFTDYSTAGYSLNLSEAKMVKVEPYRVTVAGGKRGQVFGCVRMDDFLAALAERLVRAGARNTTALEIYRRLYVPPAEIPSPEPEAPLQTKILFKHVQRLLDPSTILLAETGDSVFNCQKLCLPEGCAYEWSQQYGSIGWSVGATLGAAVAGKPHGKRVLACIGDGSFQMTAQEVSTMLRYNTNPVILLINNGGYTIEVEIHDGPYNIIKNWDYLRFAESLQNGDGELYTCRVATEAQLVAALDHVQTDAAGKLCLLEVSIHRDDCSRELLEWGARVSAANSRPPRPQ